MVLHSAFFQYVKDPEVRRAAGEPSGLFPYQSCLPAPRLGQYTDAIPQELGYSEADINTLRAKKVVA
jgi:crotonobetainyl-CoA:carnitine CoA-transferase CaiB-like acyl-CoA transferase